MGTLYLADPALRWTYRYPSGMDAVFALPMLLLPAAILWLVIYSAVRVALRHERDRKP